LSFKDLHVVVTGGTGALGRGVVARLLAEGATCHVPVYDAAELDSFPDRGHARVRTVDGVNVLDEAQVEAFFSEIPSLWGSIHVVGGFSMAPVLDTTASDFRRMFDLNALSCFLCCREAVRAMRRAPTGTGRIVNVAARPALLPTGGMIAYATSKAAVVAITQSLAAELRAEGILVNAVAPSVIDTPANRAAMPEADFSRWPRVDDVSRAVQYLVSRANVLTSGLVMPVFGQA